MALRGLLDPEADAADPALRGLIDVVPFGVPAEPPRRGPGALRAALGLPADARVLRLGRRDLGLARRADRDPRRSTHLPDGRPPRLPRRPPPGDGRARRPRARAPRRSRSRASSGSRAGACTSTRAGSPTPSAGRGCSTPTWASPPTRRTSRRASPSAPGSSTTCGPGLPVVSTDGRRARRPRRPRGPGRRRPRRATRAPSPPRARAVLADPAPPARGCARARRGAGAGSASSRRCAAFCADGPARARLAAARRALRRATLAQYPPIAARDARHRRPGVPGAQARAQPGPRRAAHVTCSVPVDERLAHRPGARATPAARRRGPRPRPLRARRARRARRALVVVLAALLTKGRPLSGADGLLAADQLQYFAWIREAAAPRPDRQPLRPRAGRPRLPAPRLRDLGRPARARALRPARLPACGSRSRSRVTFFGALALRPPAAGARGPARATPRSCSRCSRSCRPPGSSRGRTGAATRASTRSTSSRARCGRASTCGAT